MGKRDYRQREQKKVKKDARKVSPPVTIVTTPVEVEVIKKGKKKSDEEEEG
jgi:hypothetical protein